MMKKLLFLSLLIFCSSSFASTNLKIEDLRDNDNNPIKPTSTYIVEALHIKEKMPCAGISNEVNTGKGDRLAQVIESLKRPDTKTQFTIYKVKDASIFDPFIDYGKQVGRTFGFQVDKKDDL